MLLSHYRKKIESDAENILKKSLFTEKNNKLL